MISKTLILLLLGAVVCDDCYWNKECPYTLFSSKTPYDAIRHDIRDYVDPPNCEPISMWTINRHGNRNPGNSVTAAIKVIAGLKDEIIASYEAGRGGLCAQDIEHFRKWQWNETLEVSQSYLTGIGYEELYDIGRRIREKYPQLLTGSPDEYYLRPTNEQRTITSAMAFAHGLTDGTNLTVNPDAARERDDVIRPYENCDKYQEDVKTGLAVDNAVAQFASTAEYIAVRNAVQQRLGISTILSAEDIYTIYEICRFDRSWSETYKSPWCAAFTNEDLVVLEYRDDVRHYYRNGYGSWVNTRLGTLPMRDLYENMLLAVQGSGRKIVSYFTHDTMMEMVFCALDMYKDPSPLEGGVRDAGRVWRTSIIAAKANNIIALLYRCNDSGSQSHRVQILHNEKVSEVCPENGCTWEEFQQKFQNFANASLDFCSMDYPEPEFEEYLQTTQPTTAVPGSAGVLRIGWFILVQLASLLLILS